MADAPKTLPVLITPEVVQDPDRLARALMENFDSLSGEWNNLDERLEDHEAAEGEDNAPVDDAPGAEAPTGVALSFDRVERERHGGTRAIVVCDEMASGSATEPLSDITRYRFQLRVSDAAGNFLDDKPRSKSVEARDEEDANTIVRAVFRGIGFRKYYRARVRAIDRQGRRSDWSAWTPAGTASDVTPPPVPTSVTLVVRQRRFQTEWTQPADPADAEMVHPEIAYSQVQIATDSGFTNIIRNDRYVHAERKSFRAQRPGNATYHARVRNVDAAGNKSAWVTTSAQRGAPPQPAAPTIDFDTIERTKGNRIRAVVAIGAVSAVDDDISRYVVQLQTNGSSTAPPTAPFAATGHRRRQIVDVPEDDTDDPLTAVYGRVKRRWWYRARTRAVDKQGLKSPWSPWSSSYQAADTDAPPAPANVTVDNALRGVVVDWDPPEDPDEADTAHPDVDHFEVEVHSNAAFTNRLKRDRHHVQSRRQFRGLAEGGTYYARVRAVSSTGTKSGWVTSTGITTAPIVDTPQVIPNAITESRIGTDQVSTRNLAPDAVTGEQLADGAVSSQHLLAGLRAVQVVSALPGPVEAQNFAPVAGSPFTDSVDRSSYTHPSWTPVTGKLYYAVVRSHFGTAVNTPTLAGNGITWTQIGSATDSAAARRVTVFRGYASAPSAGTTVADFAGQVQLGCHIHIIEVSGADVGGTNGSNADVQVKVANNLSTAAHQVSLDAAPGANNGVLGFFGTSAATTSTPEAGYDEETDASVAGAGSVTVISRSTGEQTPSVTWATAGAGCAVAVEVKKAVGTSHQQGDVVFLTTDAAGPGTANKLFRYTGTGWTRVVDDGDISGLAVDKLLAGTIQAAIALANVFSTGSSPDPRIVIDGLSTPPAISIYGEDEVVLFRAQGGSVYVNGNFDFGPGGPGQASSLFNNIIELQEFGGIPGTYQTPARRQYIDKWGGDAGTSSVQPKWPASTKQGSLHVAIVNAVATSGSVAPVIATPAGWTAITAVSNGPATTQMFYKEDAAVSAGNTGPTFTLDRNSQVSAYLLEYTSILAPLALDKVASATGTGNIASTGTTAALVQPDELGIAALVGGAFTGGDGGGNNTLYPYSDGWEGLSLGSMPLTFAGTIAEKIQVGSTTGMGTFANAIDGSSGTWAGRVATFKAAPEGEPGTPAANKVRIYLRQGLLSMKGSDGIELPLTSRLVRKTADTAVTNSTALVNDPHLTLAVKANKSYAFDAFLIYSAPGAGDLKLSLAAPAGSTIYWVAMGVNENEGFTAAQWGVNTGTGATKSFGGAGGGLASARVVVVKGIMRVGATEGNLAVQFAQQTADATPTRLHIDSNLRIERVAN